MIGASRDQTKSRIAKSNNKVWSESKIEMRDVSASRKWKDGGGPTSSSTYERDHLPECQNDRWSGPRADFRGGEG